jgi:hypothetical protein
MSFLVNSNIFTPPFDYLIIMRFSVDFYFYS